MKLTTQQHKHTRTHISAGPERGPETLAVFPGAGDERGEPGAGGQPLHLQPDEDQHHVQLLPDPTQHHGPPEVPFPPQR